MKENIKSSVIKAKETILVLLLSIWMLIPILKDLKATIVVASIFEYTFILFMGVIGGIFLIIDICKKIKTAVDKKDFIKEMLPIIILIVFMIWALIPCFFAANTKEAFWGNGYRREGYFTYLGYAGFFACAFLIKSNKKKRFLLNVLVTVSVLNLAIAELFRQGVVIDIFVRTSVITTVFFHFNHFCYYLLISTVTSIFLCVTQKNKIIKLLNLIVSAFLMYYLIFNNTFGCYLAFIITLIFFVIYAIYKKRNRIISVIILIIAIFLSTVPKATGEIVRNNVNGLLKDISVIVDGIKKEEKSETKTKTSSKKTEDIRINTKTVENKTSQVKKTTQGIEKVGTYRGRLWKYGAIFFAQRPILGYGPDNLGVLYRGKLRVNQDRPHNLLLYLAMSTGVIGLVTYTVAIGIIWIRGIKRIKFDNDIHIIAFFVTTAYLISAMFANSMYYTSPYFFIFLGLLMNENMNSVRIKEKAKKDK